MIGISDIIRSHIKYSCSFSASSNLCCWTDANTQTLDVSHVQKNKMEVCGGVQAILAIAISWNFRQKTIRLV